MMTSNHRHIVVVILTLLLHSDNWDRIQWSYRLWELMTDLVTVVPNDTDMLGIGRRNESSCLSPMGPHTNECINMLASVWFRNVNRCQHIIVVETCDNGSTSGNREESHSLQFIDRHLNYWCIIGHNRLQRKILLWFVSNCWCVMYFHPSRNPWPSTYSYRSNKNHHIRVVLSG